MGAEKLMVDIMFKPPKFEETFNEKIIDENGKDVVPGLLNLTQIQPRRYPSGIVFQENFV